MPFKVTIQRSGEETVASFMGRVFPSAHDALEAFFAGNLAAEDWIKPEVETRALLYRNRLEPMLALFVESDGREGGLAFISLVAPARRDLWIELNPEQSSGSRPAL